MNRWLNTIVSIAIPAILLCAIAHAQGFPKQEAFVGFSYVNGDTNGGPRENLYGGEVSFSQNALKWLGAEVAGSGYYGHVVVTDVRDYGFGGGPRLNYKNFFLHSLVGADWYEACFILCITNTSFAAAFGGGIEAPLRRSYALRVSTDYALTRHLRHNQNNVRVSVGVVYRFGHTEPPAAAAGREAMPRPAMPIPALGISVSTTAENRGAEIVEVTAGGVAGLAGLHRLDIITSIDGKDVHKPMELAAALSGASGNVKIGYIFRTETGWWIGKETTVVVGK